MDMFKAGTSLEGKTLEEIFYQDFKKFNLVYKNVGISQVFTLDINEIMNRKEEFVKLIDDITGDKYYLIIMAVTDIVNEGSYIFYTSSREKMMKLVLPRRCPARYLYRQMCFKKETNSSKGYKRPVSTEIIPGIIPGTVLFVLKD